MRVEHTHPSLNGATHTTSLGSELHVQGNHEVCPLCLARYAAVHEAICVACEAPSCPDCAELMPGTPPGTVAMLCYACPVPTKH